MEEVGYLGYGYGRYGKLEDLVLERVGWYGRIRRRLRFLIVRDVVKRYMLLLEKAEA